MAKNPEFKNSQGVQVKTPESSLFGEEPVVEQKDSRERDPIVQPGVTQGLPIDSELKNAMSETVVKGGGVGAISEIEWLDMPENEDVRFQGTRIYVYPYDGQPVWLTPDGVTEYLGVWRVTREFKDGKFQPTAFWAIRNGGGQKLGFEPLGYRRYEEPLFVPQKRA